MLFNIRRNNQYKDVTIAESGTTIELGLLDYDDRCELAYALLGAVADLIRGDMDDENYRDFIMENT